MSSNSGFFVERGSPTELGQSVDVSETTDTAPPIPSTHDAGRSWTSELIQVVRDFDALPELGYGPKAWYASSEEPPPLQHTMQLTFARRFVENADNLVGLGVRLESVDHPELSVELGRMFSNLLVVRFSGEFSVVERAFHGTKEDYDMDAQPTGWMSPAPAESIERSDYRWSSEAHQTSNRLGEALQSLGHSVEACAPRQRDTLASLVVDIGIEGRPSLIELQVPVGPLSGAIAERHVASIDTDLRALSLIDTRYRDWMPHAFGYTFDDPVSTLSGQALPDGTVRFNRKLLGGECGQGRSSLYPNTIDPRALLMVHEVTHVVHAGKEAEVCGAIALALVERHGSADDVHRAQDTIAGPGGTVALERVLRLESVVQAVREELGKYATTNGHELIAEGNTVFLAGHAQEAVNHGIAELVGATIDRVVLGANRSGVNLMPVEEFRDALCTQFPK